MGAISAAGNETAVGGIGDVAAFYAATAARVNRLVHGAVRAPEPIIEDACQLAWLRLVEHRRRVRRETAVAWLVAIAVHEAFRLVRRENRELSLEALVQDGADPPRLAPSLEDLIELRVRLASMDSLSERQRQLVWLQGLGLSYAEIARETDLTRRTVERQLLRARRKLTAPVLTP